MLNMVVTGSLKWQSVCEESSTIDSTLFGKYEVKRGLRDLNGQGVLTGLTEISEIRSRKMEDDEWVPCDGKLYYQGIDIEEIVGGFWPKNDLDMRK